MLIIGKETFSKDIYDSKCHNFVLTDSKVLSNFYKIEIEINLFDLFVAKT
jgi:hypothetical protein